MSTPDTSLFAVGEWMQKGKQAWIANIGKTVAAMAVIVATIVTFTDVSLSDATAESLTCTFLLFLLAAAVMYFALEREGERLAMDSAACREATAAHAAACARIRPSSMSALYRFCDRYAEEDCLSRRRTALLAAGESEEALRAYLNGERPERRRRARLRRIARIRPLTILPSDLLTCEKEWRKSELCSPQRTKNLRLLIKLLPSLVFMCVTVPIIIRTKPDLTVQAVLDGILKLTALLSVGLRGYLQGYTYAKESFCRGSRPKRACFAALRTSCAPSRPARRRKRSREPRRASHG